jgi:uncharacterized protein
MDKARKLIWIDLENSPHVPFFIPIILELERAGCEVILTARDFAQTKELVDLAGLNARFIGGENGSSKFRKAFGLASRSTQLAWMMKSMGISLAVGHGSRGLLLAAKILRIPTLTLYDYEGASVGLFNRLSNYVMTPEAIPFATLEHLGLSKSKHLTYSGLKEDVYVSGFNPNDKIISELGLDTSSIIITIRPPSSTAHYRSEESFRLYNAIMELLAAREDVQIVLVPRDKVTQSVAGSNWRGQAGSTGPRGIILDFAVDGLNLLYHSDLVISGGGTMNREAAALGVPTVTIFKGPMGAVDQWLIDEGKMKAIERADQIIPMLVKRTSPEATRSSNTKDIIVQTILRLIA